MAKTPAKAKGCEKCGHIPETKASARDTRHAFYKALMATGCKLCPTCGDYVNPDNHDCTTYRQTGTPFVSGWVYTGDGLGTWRKTA